MEHSVVCCCCYIHCSVGFANIAIATEVPVYHMTKFTLQLQLYIIVNVAHYIPLRNKTKQRTRNKSFLTRLYSQFGPVMQ